MIDPAALRDLFDRAASLPAADRASFLAAACGGNDPLRREVERLLAADARVGSVLESVDSGSQPSPAGRDGSRTLVSGTVLGPYVIDALIGAGGMGEVYRAHDTRLGRTVAIKVLPSTLTQDHTARQRFEREAQATAALNHPNIVALYDVGESHGISYVVTELLQGETLRDRLRSGLLPMRRTIEIATSVLNGLAAAHERGIAHRDLKPENIFLTTDDQIKILDFGLAKLAQPERPNGELPTFPQDQTVPGAILGTIGYMAPEQVRGLVADTRADIFSFGAILYEMLSGTRAFKGETPADTLSAILTVDPPEIARSGEPIWPAIALVVRRCLEKDPRQRFQSARDVGFALETVTASSTAPRREPVVRVDRQRWHAEAWLVAAAVLGLGVGAVGLWPRRPSSDVSPARLAVSIALPPGVTPDGAPALAPDSHAVAFTGEDEKGVGHVWIRNFDRLDTKALDGTEGATQPFWSPDSRSIGFFARGKLWRTEVFGGAPLVLADVSSPRGGTWSKDNTIIFAPHPDSGLYRVPVTGGPAVPVTRLDASTQEIAHRWPRVLPDGRHVLLLDRMVKEMPLRHVLVVADLEDGSSKRLLDTDSTGVVADGRLLFQRANTLFAQPFDPATGGLSGEAEVIAERVWQADMAGLVGFDAVERAIAWRPGIEGHPQMTWVDRSGQRLNTIGPPGAEGPALAPDGRAVVFGRRDEQLPTVGLWRLDLAQGTTARIIPPYASGSSPVWSPDGRRLAYAPIRSGRFDVWIKELDGAGDERALVESPHMKAPVSWSPDGRYILFNESDPTSEVDLWLVESRALHASPTLVAGGRGIQCCGRFSPDGRWIAYVSNETGRYEVVVRPFQHAGATVQISVDGGFCPEWRGDGRELFFIAPGNRLTAAAVSVVGGAFKSESPTTLFKIATHRLLPDTLTDDRVYAPAHDGNRFLVSQLPRDPPPPVLNVIVGSLWQRP